jgi:hypothetical protein
MGRLPRNVGADPAPKNRAAYDSSPSPPRLSSKDFYPILAWIRQGFGGISYVKACHKRTAALLLPVRTSTHAGRRGSRDRGATRDGVARARSTRRRRGSFPGHIVDAHPVHVSDGESRLLAPAVPATSTSAMPHLPEHRGLRGAARMSIGRPAYSNRSELRPGNAMASGSDGCGSRDPDAQARRRPYSRGPAMPSRAPRSFRKVRSHTRRFPQKTTGCGARVEILKCRFGRASSHVPSCALRGGLDHFAAAPGRA